MHYVAKRDLPEFVSMLINASPVRDASGRTPLDVLPRRFAEAKCAPMLRELCTLVKLP